MERNKHPDEDIDLDVCGILGEVEEDIVEPEDEEAEE